MPWAWLVVLLLSVGVAACAPRPQTPPSRPLDRTRESGLVVVPRAPTPTPLPMLEGPPRGKVGDTLQTGQWRVTLEQVDWMGRTIAWANPPGQADASGEFLAVHLTVRNLGGETSLGFPDFELQDSEATVFRPAICCERYIAQQGKRPLSMTTGFGATSSSRMLLVFDVTPESRAFTLVFTVGKGLVWDIGGKPVA